MQLSDTITDLAKALSKLQAEIRGAERTEVNAQFSKAYSTIYDMWEAIREPIGKYGLSVVQEVTYKDKSVFLTAVLLHESGQWIKFDPLAMPVAKDGAHGIGSAITYARKYSISAILGICPGDDRDDDGNAAMAAEKKSKADITVAAPNCPQGMKLDNANTPKPPEEFVDRVELNALINAIGGDNKFMQSVLTHKKIDSLEKLPKKSFAESLKQIQEYQAYKQSQEKNGQDSSS